MALVYDVLTDCYVDTVTGQRITDVEMADMGSDQYQLALQQAYNYGWLQNGLANMGQYLGIGYATGTGPVGLNPYAQQQYPNTVNGLPYHPPKKDEPETLRGWLDRRVRETMWKPD